MGLERVRSLERELAPMCEVAEEEAPEIVLRMSGMVNEVVEED
jgi:hypothetical protein